MTARAEMSGRDVQSSEVRREVVVVGGGVAGICAGVKFQEAGIADFVILEKGHDVGGTWYWHRYPGLTIDIPSLHYCFSFEPKPDWSSLWAPGPEMEEYCRHVARK
jgi:cation diffusion facilitator CzcD-associated flavoprotein CzcO